MILNVRKNFFADRISNTDLYIKCKHEILVLHCSRIKKIQPSMFGTIVANEFFKNSNNAMNLLKEFGRYSKTYNDCN
jgi:hypothetical protein